MSSSREFNVGSVILNSNNTDKKAGPVSKLFRVLVVGGMGLAACSNGTTENPDVMQSSDAPVTDTAPAQDTSMLDTATPNDASVTPDVAADHAPVADVVEECEVVNQFPTCAHNMGLCGW